jgi:uncharacterized protein YndB with AHSA1/START domain
MPMKTVANLEVTTPSDREIMLTRMFDAPRSLVFDCYTKPELLKRWLTGPDGWALAVCDNDARVGGAFHWVWRGPDGLEMGVRGVHREVVRPERIVRTELFDKDWTGGETVARVVLTEQGDKTTVTTTVLYASLEARDGALKSGMKEGVAANNDRLAALLASELARGNSQSAA